MKDATRVWRLFHEDEDGFPAVLFHGILGANGKRYRTVDLNRWIQAEERWVYNPGKRRTSQGFLSGFHVLLDPHSAREYTYRFKHRKNLVITPIWVRKLRRKPRSKCWLAGEMYVNRREWIMALGAK